MLVPKINDLDILSGLTLVVWLIVFYVRLAYIGS